MTAGTSRFKENSENGLEAGKEIAMPTEHVSIDIGEEHSAMLTNDQGDVFLKPASLVSSKLINLFVTGNWSTASQRHDRY